MVKSKYIAPEDDQDWFSSTHVGQLSAIWNSRSRDSVVFLASMVTHTHVSTRMHAYMLMHACVCTRACTHTYLKIKIIIINIRTRQKFSVEPSNSK